MVLAGDRRPFARCVAHGVHLIPLNIDRVIVATIDSDNAPTRNTTRQRSHVLTCFPPGSEQSVSCSRNTRERGVETPLLMLGRQFLEAGWHARMSSRLAGKGACACE